MRQIARSELNFGKSTAINFPMLNMINDKLSITLIPNVYLSFWPLEKTFIFKTQFQNNKAIKTQKNPKKATKKPKKKLDSKQKKKSQK
jgi:hypothetical protein